MAKFVMMPAVLVAAEEEKYNFFSKGVPSEKTRVVELLLLLCGKYR
jgi:hypothetical protein